MTAQGSLEAALTPVTLPQSQGVLDPCSCSEDGYGDTGAGTHTQGSLEGSR
jgi:hypothetical protein